MRDAQPQGVLAQHLPDIRPKQTLDELGWACH